MFFIENNTMVCTVTNDRYQLNIRRAQCIMYGLKYIYISYIGMISEFLDN